MAKKNFTITTVATAPSPAKTGTSLVVASGTGSLFAINEPAIVFPVNDQPLVANAEIVMVTDVTTDTLTITRTQESTSARTITAGDIIIQGITAKDWNDLITAVAGKITAFADPNADRIVFWDDSAGAFAALTASTGLTLSGTNLTVRAASETATGIVERATDAEFTGGTDTTRFINAKQAASVAQTMTNKTLTSPVIDTGVSGTAVLDEDNMASDSATKLATQQSIKAYVDAQGFTWKGAWASSTAYSENDTIEHNGSGYVCTVAHTSGASTEPGVGASWTDKWDLFVEGMPEPNITTATTTNLTGLVGADGSNIEQVTKPTGAIVGTTDTQTLTNKTIDGDSNTVSNLAHGAEVDNPSSGVHGVTGDVVGTTDTQTLTNKTLTSPLFAGVIDGWISAGETWTYASATTFTISGDKRGKYQKGDKIKLTQTSVKYFYVTNVSYSSPNTTITVTGGSDYSLADATITSPYFSKIENPQGFPHWFNYTPTYGADGLTYTNVTGTAKFTIAGGIITVNIYVSGTVGGTAKAYLGITLPITTSGASTEQGCYVDFVVGHLQIMPTSTIMYMYNPTGNLTSGAGRIARGIGMYEL